MLVDILISSALVSHTAMPVRLLPSSTALSLFEGEIVMHNVKLKSGARQITSYQLQATIPHCKESCSESHAVSQLCNHRRDHLHPQDYNIKQN
jgi:hypothetical protein